MQLDSGFIFFNNQPPDDALRHQPADLVLVAATFSAVWINTHLMNKPGFLLIRQKQKNKSF